MIKGIDGEPIAVKAQSEQEYINDFTGYMVFLGHKESRARKMAHAIVETLKLLDGMNQREIKIVLDEVQKLEDEKTEFKYQTIFQEG